MNRKIYVVVVTGASSGLGKAIKSHIEEAGFSDMGLDTSLYVFGIAGPDAKGEDVSGDVFHADLTKPTENELASIWIKDMTSRILEQEGPGNDIYPILINCAGVNYIEWFDHADFGQFDRLMDINVKAGLMLIQNLIGRKPPLSDTEAEDWFRGTGAIVNIVSNASHIPMTNSAFYNATKGAFHIATLSLARELRKTHGICVFGISPNKLSGTGMSSYIEDRVPSLRGWTPEEAAKYQLAALPAGEETDPEALAEFIAFLLSKPERHKYLTGTIIPYGA